ncbi:carbohydrate ABC transporter permease [Rugosimonospora africana]|uniref:ABC transporter permease n=1 Tax=Rugosimonospora africana TaxID=556532 RepID=A0A8J3QXK2_9ACTN|nr:carbohydrate ABC transporter permease [Rugosimonospora africana]GIH19260.1 ABC transporter permease [Rugosimonospora africana]
MAIRTPDRKVATAARSATRAPHPGATLAPVPLLMRPSRSRIVRSLSRHAVTIAILVIILYPIVWMVAASLRPNSEVLGRLGLLGRVTGANYVSGWNPTSTLHFSRFFVNSLVVSGLSVVGNLFACTLAAYAFARLSFPLKRVLFGILLATILLPYQVTLVPQYILFSKLHWVNTYLPLVLPKFLGVDAFFVFLNVQFIRALPTDLDEAARIDGCGWWGVFRRIIVPLSLPAIGATAMFTFINSWNDFLGPLLYLSKPNLYTVPLGLNLFVDASGTSSFGSLFAMATLSLVPLVGFFLASQKLLVEGIATTGIK